jgi:hypothetical protein
VHSLKENKPPTSGSFILQIRFKDDDHGEGKTSEHKFDAPFKGALPPIKVEGDDCSSHAWLIFGYYKLEQKKANVFLGSCAVKVHRGISLENAECVFEKKGSKESDDSGSISMKVSISDVSAAQAYISSLPAADAANANAGGKASNELHIPMLSIDDVFNSNEAQTDAGESVKDFAKELSVQFDITNHNIEELTIATLRIGDFPVHWNLSDIAQLPMDSDIMQAYGMHPADFKKLREHLKSAPDAAGMHAYYDVLQRKSDASNLHDLDDFEWRVDTDDAPGIISQWNNSVEASLCVLLIAYCSLVASPLCLRCIRLFSAFAALTSLQLQQAAAVPGEFQFSRVVSHQDIVDQVRVPVSV